MAKRASREPHPRGQRPFQERERILDRGRGRRAAEVAIAALQVLGRAARSRARNGRARPASSRSRRRGRQRR